MEGSELPESPGFSGSTGLSEPPELPGLSGSDGFSELPLLPELSGLSVSESDGFEGVSSSSSI